MAGVDAGMMIAKSVDTEVTMFYCQAMEVGER